MIFGHNTNLKIGTVTYHVQTEDRGESHALIDTTVYYQGRVLHRRTNNYFDLLPMNEDRQQALKLRVDEQHQNVLEEMKSGAVQLATPQPTVVLPEAAAALAATATEAFPEGHESETSPAREEAIKAIALPRKLNVELINAKSWLAGKQASLQISVKEENGDPVTGAKIEVHIDGSVPSQSYTADSGIYGQAQIDFEMPRINSAEAAMVIRVEENTGKGQLRFALRAKSKVPSA
jgi:hypothetical protein